MPRLRTPPSVRSDREIVGRIKYGMAINGYNNNEMALTARVSRSTWFDRLNHPEGFTLAELRRVSQKLRMPLEVILGVAPLEGVS
ncbi:hypothetical protein CAGA_25110 [Caproiciproducens galactitolivorans]|uniref:HTH cro/C1-type domain-containing protein n=1 Tax=Caproiciproducens galactitolivorans TaxID=642589 RepID=A0A4Z0XVI1_9FIRM|nr:hypothetical protein CAGA_25110 [Caproiciproducens galactitolivorans]